MNCHKVERAATGEDTEERMKIIFNVETFKDLINLNFSYKCDTPTPTELSERKLMIKVTKKKAFHLSLVDNFMWILNFISSLTHTHSRQETTRNKLRTGGMTADFSAETRARESWQRGLGRKVVRERAMEEKKSKFETHLVIPHTFSTVSVY